MKKQYTNPMMMIVEIDVTVDTIDVSPAGDGIVEDLGGDLPA